MLQTHKDGNKMVGLEPTVIGVEDGHQQVFHLSPAHINHQFNTLQSSPAPFSRSGSLALGKPPTLPHLLLEGSKFLKWTDQVSMLQLITQQITHISHKNNIE